MGCTGSKDEVKSDPNSNADRTDLDKVFKIIEDGHYYVDSRDAFEGKVPASPAKCPYKVALTPGKTYFYCTCGLSKKQPFCDGAHKASDGYKPLKFVAEKAEGYLCGCKRNKAESGVFCDGSHSKIEW